MRPRDLVLLLACMGALVALVAIATPWWTADISFTSSGFMGAGGGEDQVSSGPFDDGDGMISEAQATFAGLFMLLALLGLVAAAVLQGLDRAGLLRWPRAATAIIAAFAALLLLLAPLLALTTWPDQSGFWDSDSGSVDNMAGSMSSSVQVFADAGWYLALVAAALATAATVVAFARPDSGATGAGPQADPPAAR